MAVRRVPERIMRSRSIGQRPGTDAVRFTTKSRRSLQRHAGKPRTQSKRAPVSTRGRRAATVQFKAGTMGADGRLPLASPSTRRANLRNAKRKHEARRGHARRRLRG
jgi:hypothetical protein